MASQRYYWFAGLCFLMWAVPSKPQHLLEDIKKIADIESDQKWSKNDTSDSQLGQIVLKREASSSRRGIDGNNTGCSRYCIQKARDAGNDSVNRINIMWKILDDSRVTFTGESASNRVRSGSSNEKTDFLWETTRISDKTDIFSDDYPKCELYLELGCEAHKSNISIETLPNEVLNRDEKKLVTVDLTEGHIEKEFNVDEVTEELRIVALGKLSQAILEIPTANPAGDSADARTRRPTLSLSRTSDGKGVRLVARNPPSGGWRLKLSGVENSNYSFSIVAASTKANVKGSNVDVSTSATSHTNDVAISNAKLLTPEHLAYPKISDGNTGGEPIKSDDQQIGEPRVQSVDVPEMLELSTSKDSFVRAEAAKLTERNVVKKNPRETNLEAEMMESQVDDKMISGRSSDESPVETAKIVETSELEELSRFAGETQTKMKMTVVDLSPNAQLIARPGIHDVVFTVTNNLPLELRHVFRARSTQFQLIGILPSDALWIRPRQTLQVAIRIQVQNTQDPTPGIVTLNVWVNDNIEATEKSTYIYVQGSRQELTTDNDKPSIEYSLNDNCNGKLSRDRCNKSLWSTDVTVKDSESGLKTVTSLPKGIELHKEFIAGTKDSVTFHYISTCCYKTVDIKATDVLGNIQTRTIDVTEWDNLSQGEVAAVVVGALFILLLIILIILLIVYCVRMRKSHDLSYSQRYGSRTPASAERTNF